MAEEISLDNYLEKLAAKTPTPGGGSAAALVGALAAALLSMAAKYVSGKAKMPKSQRRISSMIRFNEKALRRLKILMREDEKAYYRLAGEIKCRRPKNILRLYKDAIKVPLEVCGIVAECASGCPELCDYCGTSIISDVAEAVILCEAAFASAKLNVGINLRSIEDPFYKKKVNKSLGSGEIKVKKAKELTIEIMRANFLGEV